jgi:CheY-like chemotaxis protein
MSSDTCQCGFGEEYFIMEGDQSICTVCGGKVASGDGAVPAESSQQHGKRIILVDDQPFFRKRIQEALNEEGHTVLEAGEGLEAVRLLSMSMGEAARDPAKQVSLVILDLTMPGLIDGFQTLGVIKAMDEALPVLILTSSPPTQELLQRLGRLKAKKYLNKASKGLEDLLLRNLEGL